MTSTESKKPVVVEFTGTPEAGKTTQFKKIAKELRKEGFKVITIRESAEIVPSCFAKNSADAHRWMTFQTFEEMLCAYASNADVVIIDRGFVDRFIWQEIFLSDGKITQTEVDAFKMFFECFIPWPDILFAFRIPPDLSLQRRGGEGRVITKSFVTKYNSYVDSFLSNYNRKVCHVNASMSIEEVSRILMENIHRILPK